MALIGSQWFHDLVCLNNRDTLSVATMSLSHVWFFASPRTIAHQAPLSMQFSRQEYWSGLSFPSPGSFLTQGANPGLPRRRRILYHLSWEGIINVSWSYRLHLIWMCVCVCVCVLVAQSCLILCNPTHYSLSRLLCPWNSPGNNTGVGGHSLLQGIFQPRDWTQVSCTAGRFFFTIWATREALALIYSILKEDRNKMVENI